MQARLSQGEDIELRPLFARLAGTAYLSSALAVVPPFLALYVLTWSSGGWPLVLVCNAIVAVLLYAGIVQLRGTAVTFSRDRVAERGYFGRLVVTPVSELASVRVVQVYSGRSLEAYTNVFFLDGLGRTRLRLRGQFWGERMIAVALTAYELPVERLSDPIPRSELRHRYRTSLYPYERHPVFSYAFISIVLLGMGAPLIAALNSVI